MSEDRTGPVRAIVYFDGACALCNRAVARCLARGVPAGVRFASQDGDLFVRLVASRPQLESVDSMVVQVLPEMGEDGVAPAGAAAPIDAGRCRVGSRDGSENDLTAAGGADDAGLERSGPASADRLLVRSAAVLWLAARLRGPERWLALLLRPVPRALLDRGYRLLASNRQRVGRCMRQCPVPTPEQRRHFLT